MALQIIGAGWGRTGTASMRAALEALGYTCHDMRDVIERPGQAELFSQAAADPRFDWEQIYGDYTATIDWPGSAFWRELAEAYPDAKVVLTVHDPEDWFDSWPAISYRSWLDRPSDSFGSAWRTMRQRVIVERCLGGQPHDPERVATAYRRHTDAVEAAVPHHRLLVHELGQGWQPLCGFLGRPVPDQPFPHVDDQTAVLSRR